MSLNLATYTIILCIYLFLVFIEGMNGRKRDNDTLIVLILTLVWMVWFSLETFF